MIRRRWLVLILAATPALAAAGAHAQGPPAKLSSPQDLGLIEGPDRDAWQKPDEIMDALNIAEGCAVADLGAGGGWFTIRLAHRVGPNGVVWAEDIQPRMLEALGRRVQREGLLNVRTVLGTPSDPRLPSGLDAVLIVETYYELEDPVKLLKNVARALKLQGRLGVVDFTAGGGGPGPAAAERIDPQAVVKAATQSGLRFVRREAVPPFQFLLIFVRDANAHIPQ